MMTCPQCHAELRCAATRTAERSGVRWVMRLGSEVSLVYRRRSCREHGPVPTVEVPLEYLQSLEEVARAAAKPQAA
jgi:hypothetical protein